MLHLMALLTLVASPLLFCMEINETKKQDKNYYIETINFAQSINLCTDDGSVNSKCNKYNLKHTNKIWWGNDKKKIICGTIAKEAKLYKIYNDNDTSFTVIFSTNYGDTPSYFYVKCNGPARKINDKEFIKEHLKINSNPNDLLKKLKTCENFNEEDFLNKKSNQ